MVDDSFVPSSKQPIVMYCRLTDLIPAISTTTNNFINSAGILSQIYLCMNKIPSYFGIQRSPKTGYFNFERVQIEAQCRTIVHYLPWQKLIRQNFDYTYGICFCHLIWEKVLPFGYLPIKRLKISFINFC